MLLHNTTLFVCPQVIASVFFVHGVSAHGWVTVPVSKNEMAYHHYEVADSILYFQRFCAFSTCDLRHSKYQDGMPGDFRYEPQSCNIGNGIGQMVSWITKYNKTKQNKTEQNRTKTFRDTVLQHTVHM